MRQTTTQLKESILNNSKELFLKYGFKSVTMDDIARGLGMSKKTLYQHVANKEELIHLIINAHIEEDRTFCLSIQKNSKDAISEMFAMAKHYMETLRKMSTTTIYDLKKYYSNSWAVVEKYESEFFYDIIKTNLEKGVAEKLYRADIDTDIIAKLYVGKSAMVSDEDTFPPNQYRKDELFKAYFLYHIHGIATEKGIKKVNKHLEQVAKKQLSKTDK